MNGNIAAIAQSYRDRDGHMFGTLIPETVLRDGNNTVAAFVVDGAFQAPGFNAVRWRAIQRTKRSTRAGVVLRHTHCTVWADVMRFHAGSLSVWFRVIVVLTVCGLALAAWYWSLTPGGSVEELAGWLEARRHAWYALPIVMVAFVVLGLALVPVILLVAATGVAFGPLLGPVYAMAGCLASASTGFAIGRWIGVERINKIGGDRIARVTRSMKRNGIFAVYLVRKVPAPFTLANIVVGASTVRFWDFIIGTVLGMGALVVGLAGFGYQVTKAWRDPSPASLLGAALFVIVPLTLALVINYAFRRLRPAE